MTELLTDRLKKATQGLHHEAHSAASWLVKNEFELADYNTYLTQLLHVYAHLEKRLFDRLVHPVIRGIYAPALVRRPHLHYDIEQLNCQQHVDTHSTTSTYIADVSTSTAPRLAAHAWVRYMGDMAGGQAIAKLISDRLPTQFYMFDFDVPTFKDDYKAAFNSIDPVHHNEIISGAMIAFKLNIDLLAACDPKKK